MYISLQSPVSLSLSSAWQADVMLVKNAQNLMQAVIKTVQAAESACMKVCKPILISFLEL